MWKSARRIFSFTVIGLSSYKASDNMRKIQPNIFGLSCSNSSHNSCSLFISFAEIRLSSKIKERSSKSLSLATTETPLIAIIALIFSTTSLVLWYRARFVTEPPVTALAIVSEMFRLILDKLSKQTKYVFANRSSNPSVPFGIPHKSLLLGSISFSSFRIVVLLDEPFSPVKISKLCEICNPKKAVTRYNTKSFSCFSFFKLKW